MESSTGSAFITSGGFAFAKPKQWRFCLLVFIGSVGLNVAAAFLLRSHENINSLDLDEREYWNDATAFLHSGIGSFVTKRTPPFPILVAILRSTFGNNYLTVQVVLSILLGLSAVLVFCVVQRQLGAGLTAKIACIGFLLWPLFVRYNVTLYADSTALLVFLIYLLAFPLPSISDETERWRWAQFCIAGALLSACMQVKPLYIIYVPFAVALAASRETAFKRRVYAVSFLIAGCLIVSLPWSIYISSREGHFILLSANDGETLAGGLNPAIVEMSRSRVTADGRSLWVGPGKWLQTEDTGYLSQHEMELPYVERSELLKARTYAWIKSHPQAVAYLTWRKLLYMWGLYPFWNGLLPTLLGNLPLLLLLFGALLSVYVNRAALTKLALFWTLPIFSSAVCFVSWGSWRFRMPGDLGLIILITVLLAEWKTLFAMIRSRSIFYSGT